MLSNTNRFCGLRSIFTLYCFTQIQINGKQFWAIQFYLNSPALYVNSLKHTTNSMRPIWLKKNGLQLGTMSTLHPLWDLEPDFFLGVSNKTVLRFDILSRHQKKFELLHGSDQHDGSLHIGEAVGRALTPPSEAKRWESDCGSALALLLGETVWVKPAGVLKACFIII